MGKEMPSMDAWLKEAKSCENADKIGMLLTHNGVVRGTARKTVREGATDLPDVKAIEFSHDKAKVDAAIKEAYELPGIYFIKVWLNEGVLNVGDDIMYVLIGGDIRPHVIEALNTLVGKIKSECVVEKEIF